jgi:hypothetical protein
MYGIQVEQDINCRTFGRCVHGAEIDREIGNLVLPLEAEETAAAKDHGRFFRYARYNADISQEGLLKIDAKLDRLKLNNVERVGRIPSAAVQQMDAVDQIGNLRKIGAAVAKIELEVKKHFGSFLTAT